MSGCLDRLEMLNRGAMAHADAYDEAAMVFDGLVSELPDHAETNRTNAAWCRAYANNYRRTFNL